MTHIDGQYHFVKLKALKRGELRELLPEAHAAAIMYRRLAAATIL